MEPKKIIYLIFPINNAIIYLYDRYSIVYRPDQPRIWCNAEEGLYACVTYARMEVDIWVNGREYQLSVGDLSDILAAILTTPPVEWEISL